MEEALVELGATVYGNGMTTGRADGVHKATGPPRNVRAGGFHLMDFSKAKDGSPERKVNVQQGLRLRALSAGGCGYRPLPRCR